MDQVTSTTPISLSRPRALPTASDPSTILLSQGGWPACSSSQPRMESHSSTTSANTLLPLLAVILIIFPHLDPPLYHPVDSATIGFELSWYCPSHSDGPPPSPPSLKLLFVSLAWVDDVTEESICTGGMSFLGMLTCPRAGNFHRLLHLHLCIFVCQLVGHRCIFRWCKWADRRSRRGFHNGRRIERLHVSTMQGTSCRRRLRGRKNLKKLMILPCWLTS